MNNKIYKRIKKETDYLLNDNFTIRKIAKIMKVSKSTVHKDLHERLKDIDLNLYKKADEIFKKHLQIRHINGGKATKEKYKKIRKG